MSRVRPRFRTFVAALLAAALSWTGTTAAAKDDLVIGVGQFPTSFHPNLASHVVLSLIHGMTRRPFTVYDADWQLVCLLCTELPSRAAGTARDWTTADGRSGLAIDYTIRADATWGDGTPVSTDDVLFTFEIGREPTSGVVGRSVYEDIEKIVAIDAKRFTLHTNKRTCDFEGAAGFEVVPAHLERAAAVEPAAYRTRNAYDTDTTNPGLYFGPYRIARVEPGAFVVLERNPTWWGKPAHFKRITVRTIENTAALESNLLSGEIDYIAGEDGISLDQALAFEKRHGEKFRVVFKQGLFYEHIDLNLDNPILADVRVRRALIHALDREAISTRLFAGRQPVADTSVNPLDTVYDDEIRKYPYDPARARQLLDEAGWAKGRGGIRHNAKGERLALEIMSTAGNRVRELVEQVLQSYWRDVGVEVRIRNEPARVLFGQTIQQRRFSAMAMFAWFSSPRNIPKSTLHSTRIPTAANGWSGQNYTGYRSALMDETIDRLEVECADAVQRELWNRLQRTYAEDLPVIPLYFRANAFVMPPWLTGIRPTGHQFPTTLWVEEWGAK